MSGHAPTDDIADPGYARWLQELQRLAAEQDLQWLVSARSASHRKAYESGLSPVQELFALKDMSEWRGCGCGG